MPIYKTSNPIRSSAVMLTEYTPSSGYEWLSRQYSGHATILAFTQSMDAAFNTNRVIKSLSSHFNSAAEALQALQKGDKQLLREAGKINRFRNLSLKLQPFVTGAFILSNYEMLNNYLKGTIDNGSVKIDGKVVINKKDFLDFKKTLLNIKSKIIDPLLLYISEFIELYNYLNACRTRGVVPFNLKALETSPVVRAAAHALNHDVFNFMNELRKTLKLVEISDFLLRLDCKIKNETRGFFSLEVPFDAQLMDQVVKDVLSFSYALTVNDYSLGQYVQEKLAASLESQNNQSIITYLLASLFYCDEEVYRTGAIKTLDYYSPKRTPIAITNITFISECLAYRPNESNKNEYYKLINRLLFVLISLSSLTVSITINGLPLAAHIYLLLTHIRINLNDEPFISLTENQKHSLISFLDKSAAQWPEKGDNALGTCATFFLLMDVPEALRGYNLRFMSDLPPMSDKQSIDKSMAVRGIVYIDETTKTYLLRDFDGQIKEGFLTAVEGSITPALLNDPSFKKHVLETIFKAGGAQLIGENTDMSTETSTFSEISFADTSSGSSETAPSSSAMPPSLSVSVLSHDQHFLQVLQQRQEALRNKVYPSRTGNSQELHLTIKCFVQMLSKDKNSPAAYWRGTVYERKLSTVLESHQEPAKKIDYTKKAIITNPETGQTQDNPEYIVDNPKVGQQLIPSEKVEALFSLGKGVGGDKRNIVTNQLNDAQSSYLNERIDFFTVFMPRFLDDCGRLITNLTEPHEAIELYKEIFGIHKQIAQELSRRIMATSLIRIETRGRQKFIAIGKLDELKNALQEMASEQVAFIEKMAFFVKTLETSFPVPQVDQQAEILEEQQRAFDLADSAVDIANTYRFARRSLVASVQGVVDAANESEKVMNNYAKEDSAKFSKHASTLYDDAVYFSQLNVAVAPVSVVLNEHSSEPDKFAAFIDVLTAITSTEDGETPDLSQFSASVLRGVHRCLSGLQTSTDLQSCKVYVSQAYGTASSSSSGSSGSPELTDDAIVEILQSGQVGACVIEPGLLHLFTEAQKQVIAETPRTSVPPPISRDNVDASLRSSPAASSQPIVTHPTRSEPDLSRLGAQLGEKPKEIGRLDRSGTAAQSTPNLTSGTDGTGNGTQPLPLPRPTPISRTASSSFFAKGSTSGNQGSTTPKVTFREINALLESFNEALDASSSKETAEGFCAVETRKTTVAQLAAVITAVNTSNDSSVDNVRKLAKQVLEGKIVLSQIDDAATYLQSYSQVADSWKPIFTAALPDQAEEAESAAHTMTSPQSEPSVKPASDDHSSAEASQPKKKKTQKPASGDGTPKPPSSGSSGNLRKTASGDGMPKPASSDSSTPTSALGSILKSVNLSKADSLKPSSEEDQAEEAKAAEAQQQVRELFAMVTRARLAAEEAAEEAARAAAAAKQATTAVNVFEGAVRAAEESLTKAEAQKQLSDSKENQDAVEAAKELKRAAEKALRGATAQSMKCAQEAEQAETAAAAATERQQILDTKARRANNLLSDDEDDAYDQINKLYEDARKAAPDMRPPAEKVLTAEQLAHMARMSALNSTIHTGLARLAYRSDDDDQSDDSEQEDQDARSSQKGSSSLSKTHGATFSRKESPSSYQKPPARTPSP